MPRSSRHKSHKQRKHSSKEHSDSENGAKKIKERTSKDDSSNRAHGDSASGEKRKTSSLIKESRERKESSVHVNGEVSEEYVSSKRRKGKEDDFGDRDRWNGGGDGKDTSDSSFEKQLDEGKGMIIDLKHKDKSSRGESLKLERKNKSKHHERGDTSYRMEDSSAAVVVKKEERSGSVSKRKSDQDSSASKDARDSEGKNRRSNKERNGAHGSKSGDGDVKVVDWDSGKNQAGTSVEDRQSKPPRDSSEKKSKDLLQSAVPEEYEKRDCRKREGSSEREKLSDDFKEGDERHRRTKSGHPRDVKHPGDSEPKRKDDMCQESMEGRRDGKCHEATVRNSRCKDDRYHEDGDKDTRQGNGRYVKDGGRDDKHRSDCHRDDGEREYRHKDSKYRDDAERDIQHNTNTRDETDRGKRNRETKYDHDFWDRSSDRSNTKRSSDDVYFADGHASKLSAYDESPNHDYRTVRCKDNQSRKRKNEKEDCVEIKPQSTLDQRPDSGKRSRKLDPASDKMRSTSRSAHSGQTSHSKRRHSPSSSSCGLKDNHRSLKQGESKYKDCNIDERSIEHASSLERSEKTASRSLEKRALNECSQLLELSAEKHIKSDIHSSPLKRTGGSRDRKGRGGSKELGFDASPVEEDARAGDDALLASSPSTKNNNLSSSLRSLPPPPPFKGVDSPLPMSSAEDDGRSKPHNHHRRIGDHNMGRIQGSIWRGVPSWPSPTPNGLLPFPHPPPSVGFHPVLQPFPTPPMFGVRPSMDLNLHSSHQMRPMGWQSQVDDACPPIQTWDGSGAVFGDEPRIYGRPDRGQSWNMAMGHVWGEYTDDIWKGANNDKSLNSPSVGKESIFSHGGDEGSQSILPNRSDRTFLDPQADSTEIHLSVKITEKNNAAVPLKSVVDNDGSTENEITDPVCFTVCYLSRLDVSVDLAEPELVSKFTDMLSMDQAIISNVDDSKILYVGDLEAKSLAITSSSSGILPFIDDALFQSCISLYRKQKQTVQPHDAGRLKLMECDPKSYLYGSHVSSEEVCLVNTAHESQEDGLPDSPSELHPRSCLPGHLVTPTRHTTDGRAADVAPTTKELVVPSSAEIDSELPKKINSEMQPSSIASSEAIICASYPRECSENKEVKSVATADLGALVNSDVVSGAHVPASLGLSRIH